VLSLQPFALVHVDTVMGGCWLGWEVPGCCAVHIVAMAMTRMRMRAPSMVLCMLVVLLLAPRMLLLVSVESLSKGSTRDKEGENGSVVWHWPEWPWVRGRLAWHD